MKQNVNINVVVSKDLQGYKPDVYVALGSVKDGDCGLFLEVFSWCLRNMEQMRIKGTIPVW